MKQYMLIGTVVVSLLLFGKAQNAQQVAAAEIQDQGPQQHLIYTSGGVEWRKGPASLETGAEFAVLEGDPGKSGVFTMRIRMPNGFRIAPHTHPNVERVTVLSGTFHLGSGKEFDKNATEALKAGSYTSMPPEMPHYVITEGETIVQLTSVGPWEINYIRSEDDPREK